jgi:hypothetical protein
VKKTLSSVTFAGAAPLAELFATNKLRRGRRRRLLDPRRRRRPQRLR